MTKSSLQFSVIVPVFNQWNLVATLINALEKQTLSRACYEVILVDNGSDSIRIPESDLRPTVIQCAQKGAYAARNSGAKIARGKTLVFTDSDCRPSSTWLEEIGRALDFSGHSRLLLAGRVQIVTGSAQPSIFEMYDVVKGIDQERYVSAGYAATANLTVSRAMFKQLGGFDCNLYSGGDIDFCERAVRSGCELKYISNVYVEHPARTSWADVKTKARRVKGGQFMKLRSFGLFWMVLRTCLPPVYAVRRHWMSKYPFSYRLSAVYVQFRLWLVEVLEVLRLLARKEAERR